MTHSSEFTRILRRGDVIALAFGAMIGFGWIVLTGTFLADAGPLGASLAFVIGGLVVAMVGLTYSELVSAMPHAGGEQNYALRALGARPAFLTAWALILGYMSVVAFEAVALPQTMLYLFPGMLVGKMWTVAGYEVHASWAGIGVVGAIVMTGLNYVGVRPAAVFQAIAVLFLAAVGLTLIAGSVIGGDIENMQPLVSGGAAGVVTVLVATPFLFVGFDVIPQSAEEINLPFRQIGKLIVVSVALATLWYVVIMLTVGSAAPADVLAGATLAAAEGMGILWDSDAMANLLVVGGVAGILTSWNAFIVGVSRLLYAMSRASMLPRWFARVHPRFRTPSNALLFIGALSVLSPLFGENMLDWLVNAGGLTLVMAYFMVALSFMMLRRREPDMERPFRLRAGNVVGPLAALLSLGLAVLYLPGMPAALVAAEWIIIGGWWVLGAVFLLRVPSTPPGPEALAYMQRGEPGGNTS